MRYALASALLALLCLSPAWALTAEQVAKLQPAEVEAGDHYAATVSISGNTIVVGASGDDDNGEGAGAVYVFVDEGGGWSLQAKLLAADGEAGDGFGLPAAIDGATIVIGAPHDDDNGGDAGAVYVFVRENGSWSQQAKLLASDGGPGDRFGRAALNGDTAIVGAASVFSQVAKAYVFVRTGGQWQETSKLGGDDWSDYFGASVAVDGDTAAVGAFRDDDNGVDSGSAYIFTRSGEVWSQQAFLLPDDGDSDDEFGSRVTVQGDTAVIAARHDDDFGENSGSAYVFNRAPGSDVWTQEIKLLACDAASGDAFGRSLALDGEMTLIGSSGDDDYGDGAGAAYLFALFEGVWVQQTKLHASDGGPADSFGWSADLDGDTAVVGAYGPNNVGAVYVYQISGQPDGDLGPECEEVPATGFAGVVLLLVAVLGSGVYFSRRRAGT